MPQLPAGSGGSVTSPPASCTLTCITCARALDKVPHRCPKIHRGLCEATIVRVKRPVDQVPEEKHPKLMATQFDLADGPRDRRRAGQIDHVYPAHDLVFGALLEMRCCHAHVGALFPDNQSISSAVSTRHRSETRPATTDSAHLRDRHGASNLASHPASLVGFPSPVGFPSKRCLFLKLAAKTTSTSLVLADLNRPNITPSANK